MRDYHTYLVSDCVSSNTEEISQAHLDDMAKYVARVIDSRELLDMVDGGLL
jgi:nicotinamidase-related amidase